MCAESTQTQSPLWMLCSLFHDLNQPFNNSFILSAHQTFNNCSRSAATPSSEGEDLFWLKPWGNSCGLGLFEAHRDILDVPGPAAWFIQAKPLQTRALWFIFLDNNPRCSRIFIWTKIRQMQKNKPQNNTNKQSFQSCSFTSAPELCLTGIQCQPHLLQKIIAWSLKKSLERCHHCSSKLGQLVGFCSCGDGRCFSQSKIIFK